MMEVGKRRLLPRAQARDSRRRVQEVVPEARGQGVGLALMRYLAKTACQRGWNRIEWQVLDWNTHAIEFYRRLEATPKETDWIAYKLEGDALRRGAY